MTTMMVMMLIVLLNTFGVRRGTSGMQIMQYKTCKKNIDNCIVRS